MIKRLRPKYTDEELTVVYKDSYMTRNWPDHRERVTVSAALVDMFAARMCADSLADLSCGDGEIYKQSRYLYRAVYLGDYTPGWRYTGPIEKTIEQIPQVDMFILSETLEHVDDPMAVLRKIRAVTQSLFLTTPCGEDDDHNPQHYWGWDQKGMDELLYHAGFTTRVMTTWVSTKTDHYTFQFWEAT